MQIWFAQKSMHKHGWKIERIPKKCRFSEPEHVCVLWPGWGWDAIASFLCKWVKAPARIISVGLNNCCCNTAIYLQHHSRVYSIHNIHQSQCWTLLLIELWPHFSFLSWSCSAIDSTPSSWILFAMYVTNKTKALKMSLCVSVRNAGVQGRRTKCKKYSNIIQVAILLLNMLIWIHTPHKIKTGFVNICFELDLKYDKLLLCTKSTYWWHCRNVCKYFVQYMDLYNSNVPPLRSKKSIINLSIKYGIFSYLFQ